LQALRLLSKDCEFQEVTAAVYCDELIRDSFINGLKSSAIRQRLLETENIPLQRASELAESLERAHKQAASMGHSTGINLVALIPTEKSPDQKSDGENTSRFDDDDGNVAVSVVSKAHQQIKGKKTCYYYGGPMQNRNFCPARDQTCYGCGKRGHFTKVCRSYSSNKYSSSSASAYKPNDQTFLVSVFSAGAPDCLQRTVVDAKINDHPVKALLDTGASENFINKAVAEKLNLKYHKQSSNVTMASTKLNLTTHGRVNTTL